jgi:EmrB/QacA subfamily drug resistance transporter
VAVGVVFVAAVFMTIMDSTVVNVAIPTLAREFDAGNSQVQWIVTAYLLSLAACIPVSGWLGDRFGDKRTFLVALAVFTAGSVLCATATSIGQLLVWRVLQGAGGGVMMPVGTAMLFRVFPPERRARASQVLIIPTAVAPAVGPVVGGLFVEQLSWRWVFAVNLPIGLAVLVFGLLCLTNRVERASGTFDLAGFVLSSAGLALGLFAISEGPVHGWASTTVVGAGVTSLLALVLLVVVELRADDPVLDVRLFGDRLFRTSNLVCLFGYAAFLGVLFVMPLFLQEARGASAFMSGLTTAPEALGMALSSRLVARLYGPIGPRRLLAGGLAAMAVLVAAMTFLDGTTSFWTIRLLMVATGAAFAFVILPQQAATFATISPADTGRASAIYNAQRQTAAALGVAVLATVLSTATGPALRPSADDFHLVFLVAAGLAAIGALIALTIRDSDAAATMSPRLVEVVA